MILTADRNDIKVMGAFLAHSEIDLEATGTYQKRTALFFCWQEQMIRLLVTRGAEVNARTIDGYTPLIHLCSEVNTAGAVKVLLAHEDVQINAMADDNSTALCYAISEVCVEIVEMLLARADLDVDIGSCNGQSPLTMALDLSGSLYKYFVEGAMHIAMLLLSRTDLDVNKKDELENTALFIAAAGHRREPLEVLLARQDIDLELRDSNGNLVRGQINDTASDCVVQMAYLHRDDRSSRAWERRTRPVRIKPWVLDLVFTAKEKRSKLSKRRSHVISTVK